MSQIKVRAAIFHISPPQRKLSADLAGPLHLPTSLPLVTMCTLYKEELGLSLLTENRSQLAGILDNLSQSSTSKCSERGGGVTGLGQSPKRTFFSTPSLTESL